MNFKKFIGTVAATGILLSALSVTSVFAAEPTFEVGEPVDINTGKAVTEFTAGQIVEVPIDISNVDSGKLSMAQLEMYYDDTVFSAGASLTDARTYYATYRDFVALSSTENTKMIGRHNMEEDLFGDGTFMLPAGAFSGNTTASEESVTMLWNITGADSMPVKADEPEFYLLFTVKSDYKTPEDLNYGSSSLGDGLFHLIAPYVDETTSVNHADLDGTQSDAKVNACFGAFNINIDSSKLPYWIQALYVKVDGGDAVQVTEYATTDNINYAFPVRITSNSGNASSATVEVLADTSTDEAGNEGTQSQVSMGTFEVQLDSPTSYADQTVSAQ